MEYKCKFCNYKTNKYYNLKRHQSNKHKMEILTNNENENKEKKVNPNEKKENQNEKKVNPNEKKVNLKQNMCKKCNKIYKTKKSLIEHEKKCKGLDELTCPRCMISFTTKQAKSRHIIKNNCESRSIIHARKANLQNIDIQNIETQNITNNNTTNNITNNITQNITQNINNYGNERLDYLTFNKMLTIFKKIYSCPSLLTKEIHFNDNFPENNNINYENKNKSKALIKVDDDLVLKDLNSLAEQLVEEKANKVKKFAEDNEKEICKDMEIDKYKEILDLLFTYAILQQPKDKYRSEIGKVKDMIINTPTILRKYVLSVDYS